MSHDDAARAVDTLREARIDGRGVRVLMGEPERDARNEPTGQYAGALAADDPVPDFAGHEHALRDDMGSYVHSSTSQRGGSYADTDRDLITSYPMASNAFASPSTRGSSACWRRQASTTPPPTARSRSYTWAASS